MNVILLHINHQKVLATHVCLLQGDENKNANILIRVIYERFKIEEQVLSLSLSILS